MSKSLRYPIIVGAALAALAAVPAKAELLSWASASIPSGNIVTNTTTPTIVLDQLVLPPTSALIPQTGWDSRYGQNVHGRFRCTIGTAASGQGTLTLEIVYVTGSYGNPTVTVLGTTGAFTPPAGLTLNSNGFTVDVDDPFNTTGSGTAAIATAIGDVRWAGPGTGGVDPRWMAPATMASGGTSGWASGFSTVGTGYNGVALRVTWGAALSANEIACGTFQEQTN
jgi:hypothetical protein